LHIHPRGFDGRETLAAVECGAALDAIRAHCPGIPIGLSTGAWIEPDVERRLALIRQWEALPDFASVNFSEPGALELCAILLEKGVGVEAGLFTDADARLLIASGLAARCLRVLLEPREAEAHAAMETVTKMERVLDDANVITPRLLHGEDGAAWPVLNAAMQRGYDIRIGLEDTLTLPDGRRARDNAELVAIAREHADRAGWSATTGAR
jgi:uncharacterized protein (DUF849 family)